MQIPKRKYRVKEIAVSFREIEPIVKASGLDVAGGQRREDQAESHGLREGEREAKERSRTREDLAWSGLGGGQARMTHCGETRASSPVSARNH